MGLRNILLISAASLVTVAVVLGVVSTNRKNHNNQAAKASNMQTVTTVTYSGKSFSPAEITISAGTTISFVNSSATAVQVASDDAGFNSGKSLSKGESYSFTFNTKGNFTYSNKLNTAQSGKITVL